jgi:hypothetical protein
VTNGPVLPPSTLQPLQNLQLDYAWKWFSFHADQRVKMFNFMLIVFGIFATAIVSAVNYHLPAGFIAALCIVAGVLGLIFPRLDRRNRDLVWLGEDVLNHLEKTVIFGEGDGFINRDNEFVQFGILCRQSNEDYSRDERALSELLRKYLRCFPKILTWAKMRTWVTDAHLGRHRFWLPWVGYMMCVVFFVTAYWIWKNPPSPHFP